MEYGRYGGQFVPEALKTVLNAIDYAFDKAIEDPEFNHALNTLMTQYVGRENPLYHAKRLSTSLGGAQIYLKREDLNHTGAHKINNTIGQILLAKIMGKNRIIAETGAGQHGVATATAAALFGMDCMIYQGAKDMERQALNVFRMRLLGAQVVGVFDGGQTLKAAVDAAINDWIENLDDTFYLLGSAVGPHPYPKIVRYFQSVIGTETKAQIIKQSQRLPDFVVACVGGGSNAIGMFSAFLEDDSVKLIGVEAAGEGLNTKRHAATMTKGRPGIIHGMQTLGLFNEDGSISDVHSISAGLDYPGVGPEHAYLKAINRVQYVSITDKKALEAFYTLSQTEGIIPALESSHALAYAMALAKTCSPDQTIIVNLSGRGDKDVEQVMRMSEDYRV